MARNAGITIKYYDEKSEMEQVEDDFYFIGLLHDFGKVILDQIFTLLYREVILKNGNGCLSSYENEKKFPFDHTKIGAWALKEANFPFQFAKAILFHHSPENADDDVRKLCCILYLAEYFLDPGYQTIAELELKQTAEEREEAEWAARCLGTNLTSISSILAGLQTDLHMRSI